MATSLAALDRLYAARDRLVGSPRFRSLAARFPLTRPLVRRKASHAFDLAAGFVYSQVLLAVCRLGILDILGERPQSVEVVARRAGLTTDAAMRLLEAAVALDLASERGPNRYGLGESGAAIAGDAGIRAMIEHHALFYNDLADPVALLRGETQPALRSYWAYARTADPAKLPDGAVAGYSALMAASQTLIAEQVTAAYGFRAHRCLLDVGGGEGAFVAAVAKACPQLALQLFDLPSVAARAERALARLGLAHRVNVAGGDFTRDALPRGADVVTLVRVLHDHDDDVASALLRNVRRCVEPGATLVIAEPMPGTERAERVGAYFAMYLLAMGSGRLRDHDTVSRMLASAGFVGARRVPTNIPLQTSVIVAKAA
ncbi:MAG: methyltransferase [Burkholderiales bacterium]